MSMHHIYNEWQCLQHNVKLKVKLLNLNKNIECHLTISQYNREETKWRTPTQDTAQCCQRRVTHSLPRDHQEERGGPGGEQGELRFPGAGELSPKS